MGIKIVTSLEDFRALRPRTARRYITRLRLSDGLIVDSNLLDRLNRNIGACGCFVGAGFAILELFLGALWMAQAEAWQDTTAWGYYGAAFFVTALIGKLIGMVRAERIVCDTMDEILAGYEIELPSP